MTSAKHRRAKERRAPKSIDPVCVECGGAGVLVSGAVIYPHRADLHDRTYYRCACGAYVGCHPGTQLALGFPAGADTRSLRNRIHKAFDPLWKERVEQGVAQFRARGRAYKWLARELGIRPDECHISQMDGELAARALAIVQPVYDAWAAGKKKGRRPD